MRLVTLGLYTLSTAQFGFSGWGHLASPYQFQSQPCLVAMYNILILPFLRPSVFCLFFEMESHVTKAFLTV